MSVSPNSALAVERLNIFAAPIPRQQHAAPLHGRGIFNDSARSDRSATGAAALPRARTIGRLTPRR